MAAREQLDQRCLAGLVFEDAATRAVITRPLHLRAQGARFLRNLRAVHVLTDLAGFEDYAAAFEQPPVIPPEERVLLPIEIRDPSGFYLPRRLSLALPRAADPAAADAVHRPVVVAMFRSPRAGTSIHWAMIYGRLERAGAPLPAAVVRVVDEDGNTLAQSMSVMRDRAAAGIEHEQAAGRRPGAAVAAPPARWIHFDERVLGRIAVPIVGIPTTIWGTDGDSVIVEDVPVTLEVLPVDPGEQLVDPDALAAVTPEPEHRFPLNVSSGRRLDVGAIEVS
jgi:hypothetical protein